MLKGIIHKLFLLIFYPTKGWERVNKEKELHSEFINNFLYPIFGFISITTFIGSMWVSGNASLHLSIKTIMIVVIALFGGFYLASFLINELFPKYGEVKDQNLAQQFVGYSSVIVYLLYFLMPLISGFRGLWAVPLLSFFLIHSGSKLFLSIEHDKQLKFSIIALLIVLLSPLAINYLLSLLVL